MAGTIKAPSALITDMPLSTAGGISAQDIQNLIESSSPRTRKLCQSISSVTTLTGTDNDVILLTGTGTYTVTLPAVAGYTDKQITFKKTGASGTVTLDGNASETIDGATTYAVNTQWQKVTIWCDGTAWYIIA